MQIFEEVSSIKRIAAEAIASIKEATAASVAEVRAHVSGVPAEKRKRIAWSAGVAALVGVTTYFVMKRRSARAAVVQSNDESNGKGTE